MNSVLTESKPIPTDNQASFKPVRTRFAPSPTGYLHIGGARTALFAYLLAKHHHGSFILRIEDTDKERTVSDSINDIKESLEWLDIKWDEGPYIQSQRLELYQQYAKELIEKGEAYYCFCSAERLEKLRQEQAIKKIPPMYDMLCRNLTREKINEKINKGKKFVIRQKMPKTGITQFNDLIRGLIKFENQTIDDSILLKSDSYPTYHLASVVDDHSMQITHITRTEEWLPSIPKHIMLYKAFGWEIPKFAHFPLVLGPDRSKLSKRHGAAAVRDYKKLGYLPKAIINFIAFLGWNPGTEQEIFSMKELTEQFTLNRVGRAGAIFNIERLDWINGYYIRHLDNDKLANLAIPYLIEAGLIKNNPPADGAEFNYIKKVVATEQERIKKLSELPLLIDFFFKDKLDYEPELLIWKKSNNEETKKHLKLLNKYLDSLQESDFYKKLLEDTIKEWIEKNQLGVGDTLWPMRVALSGKDKSPGPFEIAEVLGKEKVLKRIQEGIDKIS